MLPNANEPENGSQTPSVGQPPASPEQDQSAPITRQEFQEGLKEFRTMVQESLNKQYQGVQSQNDQFRRNVQTTVGSLEQTLRDLQAKGLVNMSEAQINQAVREDQIDRILAQNSGEQPATPAGQQGDQAPQQGGDFNTQITAMADRLLAQHNVTLEDGDPELQQYKVAEAASNPNPEVYLMAVNQAGAAKAERLKQQSVARAPGLLPSTPDTTNPLSGVTDLDAIWSQTSLGKLRG